MTPPADAATQRCRICEGLFSASKLLCPHCGTRIPRGDWGTRAPTDYAPKRWIIARLLALTVFIGVGGLHRIYIGRWRTGLIQLFTLGGVFVWQFLDMWRMGDNDLPDAYGFPLKE